MTNTIQTISKACKAIAASAVLALTCTAIEANHARAVSIKYNFQVSPDSGSLVGETYSGFFSYDDSTLTGVGEEFLDLSALDFSFLGNNYTDPSSLSAEVGFLDGDLLGLSLSGGGFSFIPGSELDEAYFAYDLGAGQRAGFGDITYSLSQSPPDKPKTTSVPEPSIVIGLGLIAGSFLLTKRKKYSE